MSQQKLTKIIATIGPATESETILVEMIRTGMNVARFNTKHSEPAWHNERIKRVRKVAGELGKPVGVLLDLQGPEIRINLPDEKPFDVKHGEEVIFTSNPTFKAKNFVIVPQKVVDSLKVSNQILLEDGTCEFSVLSTSGDHLVATAIVDCTIKHRKTMNTPGVVLDMPSLTNRDYAYLDGVEPDLIDFVGLSFVRNATDIEVLRKEMAKRNINAAIVAKIENQAALDNIDEIIAASEVIMIARGDLGVEVPFEELTYWQKIIIAKCRDASTPVITATQMLKSMMESPRPTRAEVSDVANAIYDGTDAIMLSDETTIGKYPVKAVATQALIAQFNEEHAYAFPDDIELANDSSAESAISYAVHGILAHANYQIDKIICLTETGRTARLLSRFRTLTPIHALTSNETAQRSLSLVFGVEPHVIKMGEKRIENADKIIEHCLKHSIIKKGETIMFVHGTFWKHPGLTNTLSVVTV